MAESINTLVIGAGAVGLAVARALTAAGRDVIVIERNGNIGEETSSRNSEVIHAGIYYATGSLKARLCVAGKHALYDYCERRRIAHQRTGKLIVAVDEQQAERLAALREQATRNGVDDLEQLDAGAIRELEPAVAAVAGLLSPSTGIIDSHELMLALHADVEDNGGQFAFKTAITAAHEGDGGLRLVLETAGERTAVVAREVVNCAGLHAVDVARRLETGLDLPAAGLAKGNYFHYRGRCPFSRLIYPLPVPGGLGIHATLDLDGKLRFGPDVEWIDAIDYTVDAGRADAFAAAIRTYWPDVDAARLEPGYAGIRPKLLRDGAPVGDFEILREARGRTTLVHLLGIESPGLTACLAIGDHVVELLS